MRQLKSRAQSAIGQRPATRRHQVMPSRRSLVTQLVERRAIARKPGAEPDDAVRISGSHFPSTVGHRLVGMVFLIGASFATRPRYPL
jgi:hypothetical protein